MLTKLHASRRRSWWSVVALVGLALSTQSCGLDKLTGDQAGTVKYTFALTGDSLVAVGVSRPYAVTSSPVGADLSRTAITFVLTDTSRARIDSQPRGAGVVWISGKVNGTLNVNGIIRAPELPEGAPISKGVRVRFNGIKFDVLDTITGIGTARLANQRTPVLRGTLPGGAIISGSSLSGVLVSRDTNKIRILPAAGPAGPSIFARDTGAVWIVGTFDGSTDSVRAVVVRRVTSVVASPVTIGAVGIFRPLAVRVLDAGDSAIVGAPYRVSSYDTLALRIDTATSPTAPRIQARRAGTTAVVLANGAVVSASVPVTITQVASQLTVSAGAGQSARYGTAVAVLPTVTVQDSGGVGVAGVAVTFSVVNAGNGSVTGATATTNGAGAASVGSWVLGPNSGVDSLTATVAGLTPRVITANALAGVKTRLVVVAQPAGGGRGTKVLPAPQVAIVDSVGNTVTTANDSVTLAPTTAVGGTFAGRTTVAAVNGIARFDSVTFSDTTSAVRLRATSGTLVTDSTAAFRIGNAATLLTVTTQPNLTSTGGGRISNVGNPIRLEFRDASGAVAVGSADSVTVFLQTGLTTATLGGTTKRQAVAGVVTFDDLSIDRASSSYTLGFSTTSGLVATSRSLTVNVGVASRLQFFVQPASVAAGVGQQITVMLADSGGNTVSAPTGIPVKLRLGANPGTATPVTDSSRTLTASSSFLTFFPSVSANGVGYTLVASATGYASATSQPFTIRTPGAPVRIRFVSKEQASYLAPGGIPGLELIDAAGTRVISTFRYFLSLASAPQGASLAALAGDSTFSGSGGVSFARVTLPVAGSYRLIVSGAGVAGDTSGLVAVFPAPSSKLVVVSGAQATGVNAPLPTITVGVADSLGNVRTDNGITITASLNAPAGVTAVMAGTASVTTVSGVASFSDLSVNAAAPGYRLTFTSGSLTTVQSDTFTVRVPGAPVKVKFGAVPTAINGGSPLSPVIRASIVDAQGTVVTTRTDSVALAIIGGTAPTLRGVVRVAAVNGVATFPSVTIPKADSLLRLVVSPIAAGIASDTTASFRVAVGPANRLQFLTQPNVHLVNAAVSPALQVAVADSGGNVITSAADTIGLNEVVGTSLFGTQGRTLARPVNGIATFDSVSSGQPRGTVVRFVPYGRNRAFTSIDTSAAVTVTVGAPARVRLRSAYSKISQGGYFITASVTDVAGNTVDTASRPVTISILGAPALSGTTTATASSGTATFSNVQIAGPSLTARLVVTSPGLTPDTSAAFIVVGSAYQTRILSGPTVGVRNGVLAPVKVITVDSLGSAIQFGTTIRMSASIGDLVGTTSRTTVIASGDTLNSALFTDLASTSSGAVRLVARSTSPGGLLSDSTTVTVAPYSVASALQFAQQPSSIVAGSTMSVSPSVTIRDSVGNIVTDSVTRSVLLSLGTNPGAATLTGTLSASAPPGTGTVTFPNVSVNNVGNGYTLIATTTTPGVNGAASQSFNALTTTDALALRFITASVPAVDTAGSPLGTTGVQVEVISSVGNRVTTSATPITLSVSNNRGGSLSGTLTVSAVNGLATFTNAVLTRADTGYVLSASASALNAATAPVRMSIVTAAASNMTVLDSLPTVIAGASWPAFRVAITDPYGNVVTTATNAITIRGFQNNDSSYVTAVGGTTNAFGGVGATAAVVVQSAVNGIATFTGLRPRRAIGEPYNTLFFDATGLTTARSKRFLVNAGVATRYYTYPFNKSDFVNNEGLTAAMFVTDSLFNCTNISGTFALSLQKATGAPVTSGATIAGGSSVTLNNTCYAEFTGRSITGVTATDTLKILAAYSGSAAVTQDLTVNGTNSLTVKPFGTASKLLYLTAPTNTAANAVIASPTGVRVAVTDSLGNTVTNISTGALGVTGTISLDLSTNPAAGILSGSGPINVINGIATFPSASINAAGTGYALRARVTTGTTITGVAAALISSLFNITP